MASRSVAFAGSRRGDPSSYVARSLIHIFGNLGFSFLTGCASGVGAAYRSALETSRFREKSFIACAFDSRVRRCNLAAGRVVPDGLAPAAALHRCTVWMVRRASVLVLFPMILLPAPGAETRPSHSAPRITISFPFSSSPINRPSFGPGCHVVLSNLFGVVSGYWVYPHPVCEGGRCEDTW